MKKNILDEQSLKADLLRMGICPGDSVIVHSSMKSIGQVAGGPRAVVRALQSAVTSRGAVLMPAFSYCFENVYKETAPFDPEESPSRTGLITETFRTMRGVVRSAHPTHSVAAWGRGAKETVAGHETLSPHDVDSPFRRASRAGAMGIMIGCDFTALSLIHIAEALAGAPYLGIPCWMHLGWTANARVKGPDGRVRLVAYPEQAGCSRSFGRAQQLAEKRGIVRRVKFGNADTLLFKAEAVLGLVADAVKRRPDFLLCPRGTCPACDERRSIFDLKALSPEAALGARTIIDVVSQVGIRMCGSDAEAKAADIIAKRMKEAGLSNVRIQEFPLTTWQPGHGVLQVRRNAEWEAVPCFPWAYSPATRGRIEGPVVVVESMDSLDKLKGTRGAVALLLNGYGASSEQFRRLMRKGFRALLSVDTRFHHGDIVSSGVPAQWIPAFTLPAATVPFTQAMRVFGHGPCECRLEITGRRSPGKSMNVIGEIPGKRRDAILVCAHHDSTANSLAADDNLTGVAVVLQVAAMLRGERPEWTIRFCSFGAEEILSEGSRYYALESDEGREVKFVVNTDSGGARLGSSAVDCVGAPALSEWMHRLIAQSPIQMRVFDDICPFSDHFPFNTIGIPSLWFYRTTTGISRHFHHTVHDGLATMSFDVISRTATLQTELVRYLARRRSWPFPMRLPSALRKKCERAGKDWLTA